MKRKNLIKGALILFALAGLYVSSATFSASASGFFTGTGPMLPPLITAPDNSKCEATFGLEKHNFTFFQETMETCYSCTYGEAIASIPDSINHEVTYTYKGTESSQNMIKRSCIETADFNDICGTQGFTGSLEAITTCQDFSWTQPYN